MAIIPSLPGLRVTVEVDDKAALEFQHPSTDPDSSTTMERDDYDLPSDYAGQVPHVVRYIEATPGKELAVVVDKDASFQGTSHHLGYTLYIDDMTAGRNQQFPGDPADHWTSRFSEFSSGNPTEGYKMHKLKFEALSPTQDKGISAQDLQQQTFVANECGRLLVYIQNMDESGWKDSSRTHDKLLRLAAPELTESALRGSTADCVVIHTSEPRQDVPQPRSRREWNYTDLERRPIAAFEFIYRTTEGLSREGFYRVPPAQLQAAPTMDDNRESLTASERKKLIPLRWGRQPAGPKAAENYYPTDEGSQRNTHGTMRTRVAEAMSDVEFRARYNVWQTEDGHEVVDLTDD